jgi:hypothetical protein
VACKSVLEFVVIRDRMLSGHTPAEERLAHWLWLEDFVIRSANEELRDVKSDMISAMSS